MIRYDFKIIIKEFDERGYDLLETEYKNKEHKMKYRCRKHPDKIREIRYRCFKQGQGCRDCYEEQITMKDYEYNQRINEIHGDSIKCIDKYVNTKTKILHKCTKLECGYEWKTSPSTILQGCGCPACSNKAVFVGKNDIWTINPELAILLLNPEDGYKHTHGSNKRVDWKCPDCGTIIKNKIINHIRRDGLSCPSCSDGLSYPNKLLFNVLQSLNIEFENEKEFEWCSYLFDNKIKIGRFDFAFEYDSIRYVVEMDGHFHNNQHYNSNMPIEEIKFADSEKDRLAKEYGYEVIRIDCDYSSSDIAFEYIKSNIISSKLNNIFDLSNVNWIECHKRAQKSRIFEVCEMWNNGIKVKDIATILKTRRTTIPRYLKLGKEIGICPDYNYGKSKIVCLTTNEIFDSMVEAQNKYNISDVFSCCDNKRSYSGKHPETGERLVWVYYKDYILMDELEISNKLKTAYNAKKGVNSHMARSVICTTTNIMFQTMRYASQYYNIKETGISACCRNTIKYSGKNPITGEKLLWEYYDESKHKDCVLVV